MVKKRKIGSGFALASILPFIFIIMSQPIFITQAASDTACVGELYTPETTSDSEEMEESLDVTQESDDTEVEEAEPAPVEKEDNPLLEKEDDSLLEEKEAPSLDSVREPIVSFPLEDSEDSLVQEMSQATNQTVVFNGDTAQVSTFEELRLAVADPEIATIEVQADLSRSDTTAESAIGTLDRDLLIKGNGYLINFGGGNTTELGNGGLRLAELASGQQAVLRVENATLAKANEQAIFQAVGTGAGWELQLKDIQEASSNIMQARFAYLPQGSVVFTGGTNGFTQASSLEQTFIQARQVTFQGNSVTSISRSRVPLVFSDESVPNPTLRIMEGAQVSLRNSSSPMVDFRGTSPSFEITDQSRFSVMSFGGSSVVSLVGANPRLVIQKQSVISLSNLTSAQQGFHLSGDSPQGLIEDSRLSISGTSSGAAIALLGDQGKLEMVNTQISTSSMGGIFLSGAEAQLVLKDATLNATNQGAMRVIDIVGDEPLLQLNNSRVAKTDAFTTTTQIIRLAGKSPKFLLTNSEVELRQVNSAETILLDGSDALLELDQESLLSITTSNTARQIIALGNGNDRPTLTVKNGSSLISSGVSATVAGVISSNGHVHLFGARPTVNIEENSEVTLATTTTNGTRHGLYLNGDEARLTVRNSELHTTVGTGTSLQLSGNQPEMHLDNSQLRLTSLGSGRNLLVDGEDALVSLDNQSQLSASMSATSVIQNILIGAGNPRPKLQLQNQSNLQLTTMGTTAVASESSNNGIHLQGNQPTLALSENSTIDVEVTSNAKRAILLTGDEAEVSMTDSQLNLRTVTGQRLAINGDNAKVTMENSQGVWSATSGGGVAITGKTPQLLLDDSVLAITSTLGGNQAVLLSGEDACLLLDNQSQLEVTHSGAGNASNLVVGHAQANPKLHLRNQSNVQVITGSGTTAASTTGNNTVHVRGANPEVRIADDSELEIEVTSGLRRGLVVDGANTNFELTDSQITIKVDPQVAGIEVATYADGVATLHNSEIHSLAGIASIQTGERLTLDNTKFYGSNLLFHAQETTIENQSLVQLHSDIDSRLTSIPAANLERQGVLGSNNTANQKVTIRTDSQVAIHREDGSSWPAVRLNGDNSTILVEEGGELSIVTEGDGTPNDSQTTGTNAGISWVNTTANSTRQLLVKDLGSSVTIDAQNGAAVTTALLNQEQATTIEVGSFGSLAASANTAKVGGTFQVTRLNFDIDNPLHFDFKNKQSDGGRIFAVTHNDSLLTAANNNLTLWALGSNLAEDSTFAFNNVDYTFSGPNLNRLVSSSHPELLNESVIGTVGLSQYSRMTSERGLAALADELHLPTDADQHIYGRASVLIGPESNRPALSNEVEVTVEVQRIDGSVETYTAPTVGHTESTPGISIYGQEPQAGLFEIALEAPLNEGDQVRIVAVELTSGEPVSGYENQVLTETQTVVPVVPPTPAFFESTSVFHSAEAIHGYSENPEVTVEATYNGELLDTSEVLVNESGEFTLSLSGLPMNHGDEMQVFLRDKKGSAEAAGVSDSPPTNNEQGNCNPKERYPYHDTIFAPATILTVSVTMPPLDPLDPESEIDPADRPEIPENQGPFSIDYVSQFRFGQQTISAQDKSYFARPQYLLDSTGQVDEEQARPNFVQVSDYRGTGGWQLTVMQKQQFKDGQGRELVGAQMRLRHPEALSVAHSPTPNFVETEMIELVPGNQSSLMIFNENNQQGTWIYRFGDGETAAESVELFVPLKATPQATAYQTTFTWALQAVPEN